MAAQRLLLLATAAVLPEAAPAQPAPPPEQVIIVTAPRTLPPPDRMLGQEDIGSYGAGSIGELLEEVLAEEGENGPVVLVNGRRVSGLDELSDYPPEALQRIEVLPVGSGPSVGASPTRKVINLVLQPRFDGHIGRAGLRTATDGGWRSVRGEATATRIRGESRFNLTLRARHESRLTEDERDLLQPAGMLQGEAAARTLLPEVLATDLSLSGASRFGEAVDFSATGRLTFSSRGSGLGLSSAGERIEQRSKVLGGRLNTTLGAQLGGWNFALLGTLDADRRTVTTTLDSGTQSVIRNRSGELDLTAFRPLFELPAGPLQLNLNTGLSAERFTSFVRRSSATRFSERRVSASGGVVVPIAGGPERALHPLGELSLSLDAGISRSSGAGSFRTSALGLVWQPASVVRLSAGTSRSSSPPASRFRREALVETPNVLVIDPLTGDSVRVTERSGPIGLRLRSRVEQDRIGLTLQPKTPHALRLESEWSRRRERNVVGDLPLASSAVLAAFPERFIRDGSGALAILDVSPLLFAGRRESQWRNAINLRFNLAGATRPRAERGGGEEPGDEEAPRGGRPRLQITLAHVLLMSSRLNLREGQPAIDLLSRDGLLFAGGRPRHQVDFSANLSRRGIGVRLAGEWRSASRTLITGTSGRSERLTFGALGAFSLRAFAEAEQLLGSRVLPRGTRFSLNFTNLTNARERVRDSAGVTPLAYQTAFRDPLGRTLEVEVRARF